MKRRKERKNNMSHVSDYCFFIPDSTSVTLLAVLEFSIVKISPLPVEGCGVKPQEEGPSVQVHPLSAGSCSGCQPAACLPDTQKHLPSGAPVSACIFLSASLDLVIMDQLWPMVTLLTSQPSHRLWPHLLQRGLNSSVEKGVLSQVYSIFQYSPSVLQYLTFSFISF